MKIKFRKRGGIFPHTSFSIGAGSVLNVAGNYYRFENLQATPNADMLAIKNDFAAVAEDIRITVQQNPKRKFALANPTCQNNLKKK
jgi:hypothetical protein